MTTLTTVAKVSTALQVKHASGSAAPEILPEAFNDLAEDAGDDGILSSRHSFPTLQSPDFQSPSGVAVNSPSVELDVLEQLKSNLARLEDLHGRLKFMMNEVSYLLVRP